MSLCWKSKNWSSSCWQASQGSDSDSIHDPLNLFPSARTCLDEGVQPRECSRTCLAACHTPLCESGCLCACAGSQQKQELAKFIGEESHELNLLQQQARMWRAGESMEKHAEHRKHKQLALAAAQINSGSSSIDLEDQVAPAYVQPARRRPKLQTVQQQQQSNLPPGTDETGFRYVSCFCGTVLLRDRCTLDVFDGLLPSSKVQIFPIVLEQQCMSVYSCIVFPICSFRTLACHADHTTSYTMHSVLLLFLHDFPNFATCVPSCFTLSCYVGMCVVIRIEVYYALTTCVLHNVLCTRVVCTSRICIKI